ncbi:TetR/AcrR family transcriptional regulator [Bacillus taeanensis]|uniref:TetR/AcrR family transcriptional regulator n=1 Tax=Bacillus taeanensis TaxID=273032 RepID=A0A366XP37_9BACI|nr:TetR/AcrR family transcriptional regulator [Bacillus taeanensis]RBW67872.1 TetR/AcrR family transcriptional regulator [Bacillus taeanensis]
MTQEKTDPRIVRTRKLIMDAFIELSSEKEFKDITIKDITTKAMVNRATFYYHFADKYDLLEKVLSEVLLINLDSEKIKQNDLNEEVVVNIFLAITNFQNSLSNRCHRGYEDTIAQIIREQLEIIFCKMLLKKRSLDENTALKRAAVMLSWGIYGASVEWRRNREVPPEEFITSLLPFIMYGVDFEPYKD